MHESNQKRDEFIISRAYEGKSFDLIAKELEVSKNTLLKWERENQEIIGAFSKIKAGLIAENLKIKMENRLERLSFIQDRLFCHIESLDLENLSSQKSIELFISVQKVIREELSLQKLERFETSKCLEDSFF